MNEQLFQFFDEVDSTNEQAKRMLANGIIEEGFLIRTSFQSHGKGQLDAVWESRKGKNLLLSMVFHPIFLSLERQYFLNRIAALAVADFLCLNVADEVQIKWPNDVLVNGEKIAGILIENTVQGNKIENCIIGIGININQTKFRDYTPRATSLYNLTYREFDVEQCALIFKMCLLNRYKQLQEGLEKILVSDFNQLLFRKGEEHRYKIKGDSVKASIINVEDNGSIILKDVNGNLYECRNKELEYNFS